MYTERIGDNCFCDAISASLEFMDCIYWALDYVDYKFLYNHERFTAFDNDSNLDSIISESDPYYFKIRPESQYNMDLAKYNDSLLDKELRGMLKYVERNADEFVNELKSLYNSQGYPIMLSVNTRACKAFYKESGAIVPRTDCKHILNVLISSPDGKKCLIFDRGFNCLGKWIDSELLLKGATDNFLDRQGTFAYVAFKERMPPHLDNMRIKNKFVEHIDRALSQEFLINNHCYLNNTLALNHLKNDLRNIVENLIDMYKEFAIPLLGEAIVLQVDGSVGIYELYYEMMKHIDSAEMPRMVKELYKYTAAWQKFEARLKYMVYGKKSVEAYIESLENIVETLIQADKCINQGLIKIRNEIIK